MQRALPLLLSLLVSTPLLAFDDECSSKLTQLATLYQVRSLMAKSYTTSYDVQRFAERRIDELREPLRDGGHRWVRWVRPTGEGPAVRREHSVIALQGGTDRDRVEAAGARVYAVSVVVPRKRSLLNANNPVWIGTAEVTYDLNGRTQTKREVLNQWMNPGTSRTIDIGGIADRVQATIDSATAQRHVKHALVELHLRQAVAEDDPANPAYSTIRLLQRVRNAPDAPTVDAEIASAEASLFPGVESLPILTVLADLRRADQLMRSSKEEEQEKGSKLLKETLRRLR